eukprot:m.277235 g.277235  ORF g.277235 m.277235 type:complete len:143 (-) comp19781_c0_seq15:2162-2590(-)
MCSPNICLRAHHGTSRASKAKTPKRTVYDIQRARDAAEQERLRANKQKALVRANITIESDYHAQLDAGAGNKDPTVHEGSGIDGALSAVTGVARQISAPELSGKVTYKMFEEAQMPQYKENKPGDRWHAPSYHGALCPAVGQ